MILDNVHEWLGRFCAFPSAAAHDMLTVWIAHTHVRVNGRLAFPTTPRVLLLSDEPASGKSMVLDMIRRLSYHGETLLDPTPATIIRLIDEESATLTVDEIDIFFGAGAAHSAVRGIFNGGYRQGNKWFRANGEPRSTFAPVALAGLGQKVRTAQALQPLRERSIMINMRKGTPEEIYRMRFHDAMSARLCSDLTKWSVRNGADILEIIPEDIPDGIVARLLEVAEPLFQVADIAGGTWPERIRQAARELLLGEISPDTDADLDVAELFARDLQTVFGDSKKLSTVAIVQGLYALPDSPWRALLPNETTAPRELASMFRAFGVEPRPVDVAGRKFRGYHRFELENLVFTPANDVTAVAVTA